MVFPIFNKFLLKIVRNINLKFIIIFYNIANLTCQALCQYFSNEKSIFLLSQATKEIPMTSELIDFENELIRFENIDINDGIVYFFFVVNKSILQENDSDISSYNRLILRRPTRTIIFSR